MNYNEACRILEIAETATPEEIKKKYKELTKKFHPDLNKEPSAEEKFKKINQAYQVASAGKPKPQPQFNNFNFWDSFNNFNTFDTRVVSNINLSITISFKESVLGCKKDLKINRNIKCDPCHGQGQMTLSNGCDKCGGRGQIISNQGGALFVRQCDKCFGKKGQVQQCKQCNGDGSVKSESSVNVAIPGGVINGNILRMTQMGNFVNNMGPIDHYSDAFLTINVTPEHNLFIENNDVVSNLQISLLDVLQGVEKTINTINGDMKINIKPLSKNKEEVIIPKLGVNGTGNQRVILNVSYPDNVDKIINVLKEEK